jgi:predicted phage terminase large subunit-like protein
MTSFHNSAASPALILHAEKERRRRERERGPKVKAPALSEFVEGTTRHTLDVWQHDLCARLETLAYTTGRRILIAAPPQFGKSIIVSQRFPAWLLGQWPMHRIKLACYNITHATKFGRIVRDLMWSHEFSAMFPSGELTVPRLSSGEEWSTQARLDLRDSQPSFKSLGLATGFVGQGADTLIIDDPYASPNDAYSEIINSRVHSFWSDTAKPRLNDDTNVVVMFHRYTENDLAGWLLEQEPDDWELIRYAAVADGDYTHPVTERLYPDPLSRPEGERLSPRRSESWYVEQEKNGFIWLSQFQGRPSAKEGSFFKVGMMKVEPAAPVGLRMCRGWDLAATEGGGDFTAGVKVGKAPDGTWWILDVKRGQWGADLVENELRETTKDDGNTVRIALPQDPGQAGKKQAIQLTRMLAGFPVQAEPISGDKETRAFNFAAQVNAGNVRIIQGTWNKAFIEELRAFPMGSHDDQVDAVSDAFNRLASVGTVKFGNLRI